LSVYLNGANHFYGSRININIYIEAALSDFHKKEKNKFKGRAISHTVSARPGHIPYGYMPLPL